MLDFINIALRTIMCLAFIAFVVRPMLMSMVRREPNTLELEEMAQLAVNSAFREKFSGFYAPRPVAQLEPPSTGKDDATTTAATDAVPETPVIPLTEAEMKALAEELEADMRRQAELLKGHEEEMARRAEAAAAEAERQARLAEEKARAEAEGTEEDDEEPSLKKLRMNMKKEKKKPVIPAELLAGNSYEEKLMVVRYVTEQEQNRVANAIRSMIKIT